MQVRIINGETWDWSAEECEIFMLSESLVSAVDEWSLHRSTGPT